MTSLILGGCGSAEAPKTPNDGPPQRIVSLAPNLTEIVFATGAGDRLVGVTKHCNYPPATKDIPKVGGYMTPNLEVLLSMKPDMVLMAREGTVKPFADALKRNGIRVEAVGAKTLDDVLEAVRRVGRAVGNKQAAEELASDLARRAAKVREACSGLPKVRTMLTYGIDAQVYVAGKGSFGDDLIRIAGGENIAGDSSRAYPSFSIETVIDRAPEVILDTSMESDSEPNSSWERWPGIPAVKNDRVRCVDGDLITRAGPRLFDALEQVAEILHPEGFNREKRQR